MFLTNSKKWEQVMIYIIIFALIYQDITPKILFIANITVSQLKSRNMSLAQRFWCKKFEKLYIIQ